MTSAVLKDQGNVHFKEGRIADALACYTKALSLDPEKESERAVIYKNSAACLLKQEKYSDAIIACSQSLELVQNDPKALYRRCQAYEALGRYEEAYRDAMTLMKVDPKNTAIQPMLRKLNQIIQSKVEKQNSTDNKVNQMFDISFKEGEEDKRLTAIQNLVVLAREPAGAEKIFQSGGVPSLIQMMEMEKQLELRLTAIRVLACLVKDHAQRALSVYQTLTLKKICIYIGQVEDQMSTAMANLLQNVLLSVTNLETIKKEQETHEDERKKDPNKKLRPWLYVYDRIPPEGMQLADEVFKALITMLCHHKVSKYGRDNVMELIIKFVTKTSGVGWSVKFIDHDGIRSLLEVAGTIPEHKTIQTSEHSRMHASLCLQKIFDDLTSDKQRDLYKENVNSYFTEMLGDNIFESKLEAVMSLAALLQGPYEVGNMVLTREGIVEMILTMANSGNAIHTKYAVEALVHSASKKERCSGVIKQATPILKELYQSSNDAIKVRALVGLCKLGSFGGADASAKSFAEGSTQTLAKACRKFLSNPSKDADLRKWAAEGLAYLTLDADVKEELVKDTVALTSMLDLARLKDRSAIYPVAQILVNVTNSYDKKEIEPELLELAKFAKHHVPEEGEKDKPEFVKGRVDLLVKAGLINSLVALSDTESESSRELLCRVFNAIATDEKHRGLIVQQGGAKSLIPLALKNNNPHGKTHASQALAKIAISSNPEIAFPGQRSCEVVRPLLQLLNVECTALMNYEALLALTNLASSGEAVRKRIIKEGGISRIEYYMYEDHEMLRRASVECMCNMVMSEDVLDTFKGENDRVKLMLLYSGDEEDVNLVRAASGALAILSQDREICSKIVACSEQWFNIISQLMACELPDIQHRGVYIVFNLMSADKDIAQRLVESTMLELLMAIAIIEEPERQKAKECAEGALDKAVEWGLIKPRDEKKKGK